MHLKTENPCVAGSIPALTIFFSSPRLYPVVSGGIVPQTVDWSRFLSRDDGFELLRFIGPAGWRWWEDQRRGRLLFNGNVVL